MKRNLLLSLSLTVTYIFFAGCGKSPKDLVRQEVFGNHQGKDVYLITLTNKQGNVLRLTNYGAKINWIEVPDRKGRKANITFGYDTFEETLAGDMSYGSGRGGMPTGLPTRFTLDSVEYTSASE
jgi:aldose 1-epimerase